MGEVIIKMRYFDFEEGWVAQHFFLCLGCADDTSCASLSLLFTSGLCLGSGLSIGLVLSTVNVKRWRYV